MKTRVTINPVANRYTAPNDRIIEFTDPTTGKSGLIAFTPMSDGNLSVHAYRLDDGVLVTFTQPAN